MSVRHVETELVHFDPAPGDPYRPTSTPLYQTATFQQASATEQGPYDYSRSANPTRDVLEHQLARLERGARALAFASGMAALTAVTSLVKAGEEILAGEDLYGGTTRLLTQVIERQGIRVRYVDTRNLASVEEQWGARTRLVLVETPSNPLQRVTDIAALASVAHDRGALLAVDNSLMSPLIQRPLEHGADVAVHSATKHLCGHSDTTAGVVVTAEERLGETLAFYRNATGTALAPFDAWLLLRGLKTLGLRLGRQQATAGRVARMLRDHRLVGRVHYVGLPDHPGRDVHERQAAGAGGIVSFETGSLALSNALVQRAKLYAVTVSFGGVASSIGVPAAMSHATVPAQVRSARGLADDLVRVSVGIEHPDDLIEDLRQALDGSVSTSARSTRDRSDRS